MPRLSDWFPAALEEKTVQDCIVSLLAVVVGENEDGYKVGLPFYIIREIVRERFLESTATPNMIAWIKHHFETDPDFRAKFPKYKNAKIPPVRPWPNKKLARYVITWNKEHGGKLKFLELETEAWRRCRKTSTT